MRLAFLLLSFTFLPFETAAKRADFLKCETPTLYTVDGNLKAPK